MSCLGSSNKWQQDGVLRLIEGFNFSILIFSWHTNPVFRRLGSRQTSQNIFSLVDLVNLILLPIPKTPRLCFPANRQRVVVKYSCKLSLHLLENLSLLKNSCSKLVMASTVGWEAQLRRMRNRRMFFNVGVGALLFASASKGEI